MLCLLFTSCLLLLPDESNATEEYKTIEGDISVPSEIDASNYETNRDKLVVAFISEEHYTFCKSTNGHYSVQLKVGTEYSVRCFNTNNGANAVAFDGNVMSYVYFKTIVVDDSLSSLDIALEKGKEYTDSDSGIVYYTYDSLKIATLVKLPVKYSAETVEINGNPYEQYVVDGGQTFLIPEYVNNDYKVTFVGTTAPGNRSNNIGGLIEAPKSNIYAMNGSTYRNKVFQDPNGGVINIVFKGTVFLNHAAFVPAFPADSKVVLDPISKLNFNISFEKDVYLNSSISNNGACKASGYDLYDLKNVSIGGIFFGGFAADVKSNAISQTYQSPGSSCVFQNTHFSSITVSDKLTFSNAISGNNFKDTSIDTLGVLTGSKYSVEPNTGSSGYTIKESDKTVISSVSAYVNDPITIKIVNEGEISLKLIAKGPIPEEFAAIEGYTCELFTDEKCTIAYDGVAINEDMVLYAKYTINKYTVTVIGDGLTVKNGNVAVESGSSVEYGTELSVVLDEHIGYTPIVKVNGKSHVTDIVTVPAGNLEITCGWVMIDYNVICMGDDSVASILTGCHLGDVITLPAMDKDGFNGWTINGLLLGAQYIVNPRDAVGDTITLNASFFIPEKTSWALSVVNEGLVDKVFWTKSNAIGSYGIVTVIPGEFEKATVAIEPAVAGAYVGKLSDSTYMVYSANGEDVTVTVSFQSVGKASEYVVSLVEIAKDGAPGFRATVTATDGGVIDTTGTLSIRYVYKEKENGLWCYTTSGPSGTEGVPDRTFDLSNMGNAYAVSKDFYLSDVENADGAYLVYGYASYSFKDTSAGSEATVTVASPVIMSVSEIQAVVSKT